ncbi:MAG: DUF21 domain-containing protein [Planctomycetes bacterium]|nr:DUF21 domain-containing protein [Planctomycetota bacterium]
MTLAHWIAFVSVVMSCFYTANNYALLDFSRSRLAALLKARGREAWVDHLDEFHDGMILITALMRTMANVAILLAMIAWITPPQEQHTWTDLGAAVVVAAVLMMVFGVAVPLSWSRHAAEPLLAFSLPILHVTYVLLRPLMAVLHAFDPLVRRLLGVPANLDDDATEAEQEILDAVSEGEKSGLVDEEQKEMIEAVVEFPTTTVEQIMTPRIAIEGVSADATLADIKAFVSEAGHSRVPVYEGDLDHIVGILYVKDLIPLLGAATAESFNLRKMLREAVFVPESKPLRDLLGQFKASKVHLAMVLDEYGGTAGLVTIEDVIEEIVGEIHDEHEPVDEEMPAIERVDPTVFEVDGRVRIDDVNDELQVSIPEDEDYDTIGGFVFATLGRIPDMGESFDYDNLRITISEAEKTRVAKVKIEVLDRTEQPSEATE